MWHVHSCLSIANRTINRPTILSIYKCNIKTKFNMPPLKSDDSRLRTLWSEGIAIFENVLTTMVTSPRPRKETSNHFIVDIHYELMAVKLILANMQTSDGRTKSNQNNPAQPNHVIYHILVYWCDFLSNKIKLVDLVTK